MATPCFELIYRDGTEVDTGDGIPHYTTFDEAAAEASRFEVGFLGTPVPRQRDEPCVHISCGCGYFEDEADMFIYHFANRAEGLAAVKSSGWKVVGDEAFCPGCEPETAVAS